MALINQNEPKCQLESFTLQNCQLLSQPPYQFHVYSVLSPTKLTTNRYTPTHTHNHPQLYFQNIHVLSLLL